MLSAPPNASVDRAYRLYHNGDAPSAADLCRQFLRHDPHHAEAIYLLGVIAMNAGALEEACPLFVQAVQQGPENAVFVSTLGEAHLALNRPVEAQTCFHRAIVLRPGYERAHNNLGRTLHAAGDLAAARASFAAALRINPRYATAHNNLGAVLQAEGRIESAAAHFREALAIQPDYPEAEFNLGTALQALGDPAAAAVRLRRAIRLRPAYARAHFVLGQVLEQLRADHDALACYETAARLQPGDAEIERRLGDLLVLKKDGPAALAALGRAVALQPDDPAPRARLFHARQQVCDWRTYDADLDRLWSDTERQIAAGEPTAVVPFQALSLPWPPPRLLAVARSHSASSVRHQHARGRTLDVMHPDPNRRTGRLRVGYLSGDFYDHPISHLLHGFFGRHDRTRFEVFAYSFGPQDDSPYRRRIAAEVEHFVELAPLSLRDLARRIAADGIQILVDLMGHTGVNRLGTLALRPAPIQVSFLGMLGTMGADFIDYLITDRVVTPPELAPAFTERFVTLPHSYLVAEPEPDLPDGAVDRGALGLPGDGFVFCSFNSSYKIEPRTFGVWMRILSQVPGSVLWLCSPGRSAEDNLRREAAARGVAPERLVFAPFVPRTDHLRRQRAADLFLDTLLYNAAATASLALQAGVPVLTCRGNTFASRVGASLLTAVGLPELIAPDDAEYERTAIHLARNPDTLAQLSRRLAAARTTTPLFDPARFVANLERAYRLLWEQHAAGVAPRAIDVVEEG